MPYPTPAQLELPVQPYHVTGYHFAQKVRRKIVLWATHLGDDVVVSAGKPVSAIGAGEVVWAEIRPGKPDHRNWGGIIVIGHTHQKTGESFFSVYGHLRDLTVTVGQQINAQERLGVVAPGLTPENGWWQIPHLHFAIYQGPWQNTILPGYKRLEERRTKVRWWRNPQEFIEAYNLDQVRGEGNSRV